jgi:ribosomal protein L24
MWAIVQKVTAPWSPNNRETGYSKIKRQAQVDISQVKLPNPKSKERKDLALHVKENRMYKMYKRRKNYNNYLVLDNIIFPNKEVVIMDGNHRLKAD